MSLYNKNFLSMLDFSNAEINYLLNLAVLLKKKRQSGVAGNLLKGKNLAMLFEKPSTRTRCAFEMAMVEEGGYASYIDATNSQFNSKESVEDSAEIFSKFYQAIQYRGFGQDILQKLANYASVPVYNGLTDEEHPTQILADLMTVKELVSHKSFAQIKVVYVGNTRNNVAVSWMYAAALMGIQFVAYGPKELYPEKYILENTLKIAQSSGAKIEVTSNLNCLKNADVIYTDSWVSMGEENKILERYHLLKDYKVTMKMLEQTHNDRVIFMHCLPALHDQSTLFVKENMQKLGIDVTEVSDDVFRSKNSVVFDQAENRLHAIKAILVATLSKENVL